MTEPSAYYLPVDPDAGLFDSTPATESPWDAASQHGGPPAALLLRAIDATASDPTAMPVARLSVDMLGGIPQGRMRTEATVVRPGKRVEMVEASLYADDDLAVRATAWRIRRGPATTTDHVTAGDVPPLPDEQPQRYFPGTSPDWGYGRSVEWRFVAGGYAEPGPATVWARPRIPLVEGEEATPQQRAMVVADSANGLSGQLPMTEWLFIPPTVTVTFQRPPTGEWILLDAATTIGPDGTGLASGTLSDADGLVAAVAQPLLVARR
ncbi:thioesterase family protein [Nocardioides sp. CFH 31398]|uniref:thioesterase family protein n=1 Tax=Nocardioides sp. CFH 31398 TaxID=2919579 RepID=UPI001F06C0FA|nr:thioesterase family protein [Nocardioides sp. CFH 31398]MCH1865380.1 thioesterase family protein [Nocardioides sp. CFH 31398]